MKRGDLVTVATSGDYGKPRPALLMQADIYAEHPSLTVLPLTSELHDMPSIRLTVEPGRGTGRQRLPSLATSCPKAGRIGSR